jgi:hypothetical protein
MGQLKIEDYKRMMRQCDMRAAGTLETMSDALLCEFEGAVDAYADSDERNRRVDMTRSRQPRSFDGKSLKP